MRAPGPPQTGVACSKRKFKGRVRPGMSGGKGDSPGHARTPPRPVIGTKVNQPEAIVVKRPHGGGPVAKREVVSERTGARAETKRKRPLAQCEQRARSICATRNIKSATDSITAGTGAGTSSKARQAASFTALWRLASRP